MDLLYWFGGKRPLRKEIIPFLVPLIKDVREFREPFCGSAANCTALDEPLSEPDLLDQ